MSIAFLKVVQSLEAKDVEHEKQDARQTRGRNTNGSARANLLRSLGSSQNNQDSSSLCEGHGSLAHGDDKQSRE